MRVAGKVALVTGAAQGIGFGIARKLAEHGARVIVADVNAQAGARAVAELGAVRDDAAFAHLDVASEASWDALRPLCADRLDIAVNAAGVFATRGHPFDEITLEEWHRIQAVNLDGVFLGTRFAVRVMKAQGAGAIVNIGSIAGMAGSRGGAAYGASKAGVHAITKQAAFSCARAGYGIRVNCILPGYLWTPGIAARDPTRFGSDDDARTALAARHPLNVPVDPEDIAWATLYLASDEARAVTGVELPVDGGVLAALWGAS